MFLPSFPPEEGAIALNPAASRADPSQEWIS
jgi:hypothetical protein